MRNQFGFISGCFVCNEKHSPAECDLAKSLVRQMPTKLEIPKKFLRVFFEDRRRKLPLEWSNILTMAKQMGMSLYMLECGQVWTLEFSKSMRDNDAVVNFDYASRRVVSMPVDNLTVDAAALLQLEDSKFEISPEMAQAARAVMVEDQVAGDGKTAAQSNP